MRHKKNQEASQVSQMRPALAGFFAKTAKMIFPMSPIQKLKAGDVMFQFLGRCYECDLVVHSSRSVTTHFPPEKLLFAATPKIAGHNLDKMIFGCIAWHRHIFP
jgi:hypothetical protein